MRRERGSQEEGSRGCPNSVKILNGTKQSLEHWTLDPQSLQKAGGSSTAAQPHKSAG